MKYKLIKLMNTAEAADYSRTGVSTLEKLRVQGGGPIYIKRGRRVLYDPADLDTWLVTMRRHSTSDVLINNLSTGKA